MDSSYKYISWCLFGLSFLLCVFSFIFHIVGLASPGWIVMSYTVNINVNVYIGYGPRGVLTCVNDKCQTSSMFQNDQQPEQQEISTTDQYDRLQSILIFEVGVYFYSAALILLVQYHSWIGAVASYFFIKDRLEARNIKIVAALTFTGVGCLSGCADIIVALGLDKIKKKLLSAMVASANGNLPEITVEQPYSLVLVGVGGALAILAAIITGFEAYVAIKAKKKIEYELVPIEVLTNG